MAFRQLRQTPHQPYGHTPATLELFFAQFAKKGIGFFNRFAAHCTSVYQYKICVMVIFNERIANARQFRLNGMGIVFIHLTTKSYYVRSHGLLSKYKINSAS